MYKPKDFVIKNVNAFIYGIIGDSKVSDTIFPFLHISNAKFHLKKTSANPING